MNKNRIYKKKKQVTTTQIQDSSRKNGGFTPSLKVKILKFNFQQAEKILGLIFA